MTEHRPSTLSFDWGSTHAYSADLRARELVDRVHWFIMMRWIAAGACLLTDVGAMLKLLPADINPGFFLAGAVFLFLSNLYYRRRSFAVLSPTIDQEGMYVLLLMQILGDFAILTLLTYGTGTIQTPIAMLFTAHVVLATLFFHRWVSLAITGLAWIGGVGPIVLECLGVIPIVSIYDSPFKPFVLNNPTAIGGYVFGLGLCLVVIWYLVSEITTSLKLREGQLEDAYEILSKLDREKSQATLRATHELKAPFAAIKSYVYTLRDGYCGELPDKASAVVARIGERCDRLMAKITDIIHLSNLKTLVLTDMHFSPVNIKTLLLVEAEEARLLAESRRIEVFSDIETADDVFVMGSTDYLHTLFSNLLRNAVIYSHNGGRIELTLRFKPKKVSVRVTDHGIGIPKDNISKIFDEHFRSNNAVAHNPNGTGLGLPMVKEIVRLHGGAMEVSSELGEGSQFTVSFDRIETPS